MKRLNLLTPLAVATALAGCNSSPSVTATNASVEEVSNKLAAASANGQFLSPGRWETTMTITDMTVPGMPPGATEKMKAQMGKGRTIASCLTPEEAKAPKGNFFGAQSDCVYDHYTMGGGKIDAKMVCRAEGHSRTVALAGTYGPDTYSMAVDSSASGAPGPMGSVSVKMKMDARRTGACNGTENR